MKKKNNLKRFDYRKKSDRFLIAGAIAEFLLPGTGIGGALLIASAGNAVADAYWHPEHVADYVERWAPMCEEAMTKEEIEYLEKRDNKDNDGKNNVNKEGGK